MKEMPILRVSSEGGPLIVCDATAIPKWHGAYGHEHFERACNSVSAEHPVDSVIVNGAAVLAWNMRGAGTADILNDGNGACVIRYWADDFLDKATLRHVLEVSRNQMHMTELTLDVDSGVLVVLWAAEDGSKLSIGQLPWGTPEGELSIGDGAVYMRVDAGRFVAGQREVSVGGIDFVTLELYKQSRR